MIAPTPVAIIKPLNASFAAVAWNATPFNAALNTRANAAARLALSPNASIAKPPALVRNIIMPWAMLRPLMAFVRLVMLNMVMPIWAVKFKYGCMPPTTPAMRSVIAPN